MSADRYPKRIVCLTEEPTETLYLLGEQHRIVGISGFTRRPPQARKEKPKVSAFLDADIEKIVALNPDLVIGFSDIQASIAQRLIARGVTVWVNNYRSVDGILAMIVQLGSLVGQSARAVALAEQMERAMEATQRRALLRPAQPRVYFEEWYDPLITGIQWVSELIALAGGVDLFAHRGMQPMAKDRILADPNEVMRQNPDIILASWCGKAFKREKMLSRPGWDAIAAVQHGDVYEIPSEIILQPGPASVTEGLELLSSLFDAWAARWLA